MRKVQRMKEEGKNRQAKGSLPQVGTARFPSRMSLQAGGRAVRLFAWKGAQASRLSAERSLGARPPRAFRHAPRAAVRKNIWADGQWCRARGRTRRHPGAGAVPETKVRLRRESGTTAASGSSPTPRRARHPYQILSKGAAAPIWHMVPPVVSKTALTTKPPGGGEEAHRRWPEGRSERGASKANQRPLEGRPPCRPTLAGPACPHPSDKAASARGKSRR